MRDEDQRHRVIVSRIPYRVDGNSVASMMWAEERETSVDMKCTSFAGVEGNNQWRQSGGACRRFGGKRVVMEAYHAPVDKRPRAVMINV